jgi:hypothetical protein
VDLREVAEPLVGSGAAADGHWLALLRGPTRYPFANLEADLADHVLTGFISRTEDKLVRFLVEQVQLARVRPSDLEGDVHGMPQHILKIERGAGCLGHLPKGFGFGAPFGSFAPQVIQHPLRFLKGAVPELDLPHERLSICPVRRPVEWKSSELADAKAGSHRYGPAQMS